MGVAVSRAGLLAWARIPAVVIATAFPVVFAKHIESFELTFLIGFLMLVAAASGVELLYDRKVAAELEDARRRLQIQKARGLTMGRLFGLVSPVAAVLAYKDSLTPAQKEAAKNRIDESIVQVLKAVCEEAWTYWNPFGSAEAPVQGSVMVAHATATCGPAILAELDARAKFVSFGRGLSSYKHVLDVVFCSESSPKFVPIAIPVEDENSPQGIKRLLPGAPTAFATGEDVIIPDTRDLRGHTGSDVDPDVLREDQGYFESRKIRSMACLLLHETRDKKQSQNRVGVLNIHSDRVGVLGTSRQEQQTIIGSLEHYRVALEYLLDGQRQLSA